jgi:gamma-glutamylputrescine oxidase
MTPSSHWDDHLLEADVVIVGAGIIGITTALELRAHNPRLRVLVLERDVVPAGATLRNAGFACFGSLGEIAHDIDVMGEAEALDVIARRIEGLERLRRRCGDDHLGFEQHGGHELFLAPHSALARLHHINTILAPLFKGAPVFTRCDELVAPYRFGGVVQAMVRTPYEGTIDSGRLVARLLALARAAGADVRFGTLVEHIEDGHGSVLLHVRTTLGTRTVRGAVAVLAVNGFMRDIDPGASVVPGRGQVLITEPIEGLPFKGSFHFDDGYWYFRNVGSRILFGGGRHLELERETTTELSVTESLQNHLEHHLRTIIAPWADVRIARRWSGIMGFTPNKHPLVVRRGNIVTAFGCNGMGVAIGSTIGMEAAQLCG